MGLSPMSVQIIYDEPVIVRGIPVLVGRAAGVIVDIRIPRTETQHYQLITHANNKSNTWKTSCYTYLFQCELAAFNQKCLTEPELNTPQIQALTQELREFSQRYAAFEAMVNNPPLGLTRESMGLLYQEVEKLGKAMKDLPEAMKAKMLPSLLKFKDDLVYLYQKPNRGEPLSKAEIRRFFSIQQEDSREGACLGKFLADQMSALTAYGVDRVYEITDESPDNRPWNRFKQLFAMHPLLKCLSDAHANIEQKGLSLYGARFNNCRDPVPGDMLRVIGPQPKEKNPPEALWTSLMPYLDRPDDLEELDKLLLIANDQPYTPIKNKSGYWGRQAVVFLANLIELPFALALRLAPALILSIPVIAVRLAADIAINVLSVPILFLFPQAEQAINRFRHWLDLAIPQILYGSAFLVILIPMMIFGYKESVINFLRDPMKNLDKIFEGIHQKLSLVKRAKKYRNENLDQIHPELKKSEISNQPQSLYATLLNELNPSQISDFFIKGFNTMVASVISPLKIMVNGLRAGWNRLFPSRENYNQQVFNQYNGKFSEAAAQAYRSQLNQKYSGQLSSAPNPELRNFRNSPKPWVMNEISSPLDFLDEIFVGLADVVIGPMFRKSPGLATFFFLLANASFATLAIPALNNAAATSWLKFLPKALSESFMGKHAGASQSMFNQLFAVFLQWKVTFFAAEGILEVAHGDMDYLKALLHHPEKITLATGVMVAMGLAMNWMPEIDSESKIPFHKLGGNFEDVEFTNYYIEIFNLFSHEAKEVTEYGMPPFTGIEYAFLSLKSIFLVEDMMSGGHEGHSPEVAEIFGAESESTKEIIQFMMKNHAQHHQEKTLKELIGESNLGEEGVKAQLIEPAIIAYCQANKIRYADKALKECVQFFFVNLKNALPLAAQVKLESDNNITQMNQTLVRLDKHKQNQPAHRQNLLNAIEAVQRMEATGQGFDTEDEAIAFYDYLYKVFKDYNKEQRSLGHWDKQLDKEHFLHAFYNKHIYKGSNNFIRLLSIFPLYPFTLAWRGIQSLSGSPATQYKLKRSFRKDALMGIQTGAMIGRVGYELGRAYTYGVVGVFSALAFVVSIPMFVYPPLQRGFMNKVIDAMSYLIKASPYHAQTPERVKAGYSRFAKVAGTGSEHLQAASKAVTAQVLEHAAAPEAMLLKSYRQQHQKGLFDSKKARRTEKELLAAFAGFETQVKDLERRFEAANKDTGPLTEAQNFLRKLKQDGSFTIPEKPGEVLKQIRALQIKLDEIGHKLTISNTGGFPAK